MGNYMMLPIPAILSTISNHKKYFELQFASKDGKEKF